MRVFFLNSSDHLPATHTLLALTVKAQRQRCALHSDLLGLDLEEFMADEPLRVEWNGERVVEFSGLLLLKRGRGKTAPTGVRGSAFGII